MRSSYPATVTSTEDPEKRGRIKVACSAMMGDEETEIPQWVQPIYEWGWFVVPDPGEIVDLEVTEGHHDDEHFGQSSIANLDPRWKGRQRHRGEAARSRRLQDQLR